MTTVGGSPLGPGRQSRTPHAQDATGFLVVVELEPGLDEAAQDEALAAVERTLDGVPEALEPLAPDARGLVGGTTLIVEAITSQVEEDLATGEAIALPVALVIMVLVFGGFLAASMPSGGATKKKGGPSAEDEAAERERREAAERRAQLEQARDEARAALDEATAAADRATEEADHRAEEVDRLKAELAEAQEAEREAGTAARAAREEVRRRRAAADEAEAALAADGG